MTIEIIHLKQFHRIPGIPEYDKQNNICNIVVKSQLNLAKYLERNNDIPVVSESLYDNINCENSSEMCAVTKQYIFPNGLPDSFEQLTHVQKAMLYEYGAAITLTYAGVLPKTYPSIDKDNSDKIDNDFSKGIYNDIFSTREKFAIENAKLAAQDYYDDSTQGKVFIIFGGAHDFSKECDEFGYKISEIDFSLRDEVGLAYPDSMEVSHIEDQQSSSIFSEQLKILSTNHPYRTNQLIQSKHVNIKELSAFAENHFEVLQDVIKRGGLIDFIATGALHLGQLLEVFYDKEYMQHLWGVVKDSLLSHDISFDQLLAIQNDKMDTMHSFKTTQELASYVTNIVGDMDKECDEFGYKISEIDFSLRDEADLACPDSMEVSHIEDQQSSSIFSEQLKILSTNHPYRTNQLIQSKHVNIKELSAFAENHFEVLQDVVKRGGLIDFIATGALHLEQLLEVFYDKEHMQHLWGVVKDSLLSHDISFDQLLAIQNDKMDAMHSFKTTQELASYVTNIVGDMDHDTCSWFQ